MKIQNYIIKNKNININNIKEIIDKLKKYFDNIIIKKDNLNIYSIIFKKYKDLKNFKGDILIKKMKLYKKTYILVLTQLILIIIN